ncbi:lipase [Caedimonas varicaedens]|uniref:Lipase n=1 Tax=Caedimonas varicaedens TaxID=1629334 RepID=A0A0K8MCS0_9PROT|nr:lipase [Caedimonas varicaedens]
MLRLFSFFILLTFLNFPVLGSLSPLEEEIKQSTQRLFALSNDNYGNDPIYEIVQGKVIPIGSFNFQNANGIIISFRGADNLDEALQTLDKSTVSSKKDFRLLEGNIHRGYYETFQGISNLVYKYLLQYAKKQGKDLKDYDITVEGYSRGGSLANLIALKIYEETNSEKMNVFTYGASAIFDSTAAFYYAVKVGFKNHFNFMVAEDDIAYFFERRLGFYPVGTKVEFSACDSPDYKSRVKTLAFTRMDKELRNVLSNPWGNLLSVVAQASLDIGVPITIDSWEAHVFSTYQDVGLKAFKKFSAQRSGESKLIPNKSLEFKPFDFSSFISAIPEEKKETLPVTHRLLPKVVAQIEEPQLLTLYDIKTHPTLKPAFKTVFNECYKKIEQKSGCKSSGFSLIHWLNKGGDEKIFNFYSWLWFQKQGFSFDRADSNMDPEDVQLRTVSEILYNDFLAQQKVKIIDFKVHLKKD